MGYIYIYIYPKKLQFAAYGQFVLVLCRIGFFIKDHGDIEISGFLSLPVRRGGYHGTYITLVPSLLYTPVLWVHGIHGFSFLVSLSVNFDFLAAKSSSINHFVSL